MSSIQVAAIKWPWALDDTHLERRAHAQECAGILHFEVDPDLPPSRAKVLHHLRSQFFEISQVLEGFAPHFSNLMSDWDESLRKRKHKTSNPMLTHDFVHAHNLNLLDNADTFLVQDICVPELAQLMEKSQRLEQPDMANLAFGPGAAMLVYLVLGFWLKISAESAYRLASQGLLIRNQSDYELAWAAMRERVLLGIMGESKFRDSHRIPDFTLELPPQLQVLPGPLLEVCRCII
jgi:hypothetical protein